MDYREYYRRHGYRWDGHRGAGGYGEQNTYYGSPEYRDDLHREYRETDRLNDYELDRQAYNDDDYGAGPDGPPDGPYDQNGN